jgi:hypothetical protein
MYVRMAAFIGCTGFTPPESPTVLIQVQNRSNLRQNWLILDPHYKSCLDWSIKMIIVVIADFKNIELCKLRSVHRFTVVSIINSSFANQSESERRSNIFGVSSCCYDLPGVFLRLVRTSPGEQTTRQKQPIQSTGNILMLVLRGTRIVVARTNTPVRNCAHTYCTIAPSGSLHYIMHMTVIGSIRIQYLSKTACCYLFTPEC